MKKIFYKTNQNDPQVRAYKEAVERGRQDHHVVYKDDSWRVIRGDAQRPLETFSTQEEAIKRAKLIARSQGTAVYIHGVDGRIRERESYGNDPFPPRNVTH
ncbi:DUF2188 domain-containing protein [Candidatus Daviesbacteria bacterium]|nr:DUF2188 domain-containing protein [Candidatus Daviesbacteria bacterium]